MVQSNLNQQNINHQTQKYNNIKRKETNYNPGLVTSCDIWSGNGVGLHVFTKEKIKK